MFMRTTLALLSGAILIAGDAHAQSGGWSFERLVDPITDEVRGIAVVTSGEYSLVLKCDYGGEGVYADLYRRRARQASQLYGATTRRPTTTTSIIERVDQEEPRSNTWIGDSGEYLQGSNETRSFAAKLLTGRRLALRIPNYSRSDDVIFSLVGSSNAITSVYRACRQPIPR